MLALSENLAAEPHSIGRRPAPSQSIRQRPHRSYIPAVEPPRFVVMGVAGAGKSLIGSRLAAALDIAFVEGDDYHPPGNLALMRAGIALTDADRLPWLTALAALLAAARRDGQGLVLACSALKQSYRDLLRAADADVHFIHLDGTPRLIAQRLGHRTGHYMPLSLLDSQFATLEPPAADERAWTMNAGQTPEAIVNAIVARLEAT